MTTQTTYPTTYCGPGEGAELYSVDAEVTVKCRAAQTGGGFEVFEVDMPRGASLQELMPLMHDVDSRNGVEFVA